MFFNQVYKDQKAVWFPDSATEVQQVHRKEKFQVHKLLTCPV